MHDNVDGSVQIIFVDKASREKQIEEIVSRKKLKNPSICSIPKRFVFVFMSFLAFNMLYILRVNLSVTIVPMVKHLQTNQTAENSTDALGHSNSTNKIYGEFDWDEKTQGIILGSFFWGYVMTQIPGGRLADIFGSKWLLGYGIFFTSLLTVVSPFAARSHYLLFVACRVLEGVFEGLAYPSMHSMLAKWLPTFERSTASALIYSGTQTGTVLAMPITALLCDWQWIGGWPSAFYIFGLVGIVWSILWHLCIYETPESHANITQQELKFILTNQPNDSSKKKPNIPYKSVFTSVPLWALTVAHFGQNWGFYTLLTQMPRFLQGVHKFDLKQNGLFSALPYLSQAVVGCSIGIICDKLYKTGRFRLGTLRKTFNTIGFVGPALCLFMITLIGHEKFWTVVLFILAMGFNGTVVAGFQVTHVDMAPNFASSLMGMTNCIANFPGILAPYVVGVILSSVESTSEENILQAWHYIFYLSSSIYIISAFIYVILGSNELQPWNNPENLKKKKEQLKNQDNH